MWYSNCFVLYCRVWQNLESLVLRNYMHYLLLEKNMVEISFIHIHCVGMKCHVMHSWSFSQGQSYYSSYPCYFTCLFIDLRFAYVLRGGFNKSLLTDLSSLLLAFCYWLLCHVTWLGFVGEPVYLLLNWLFCVMWSDLIDQTYLSVYYMMHFVNV